MLWFSCWVVSDSLWPHRLSVYLSFSPSPFASLLFIAICKASSDNRFAFWHFFLLEMVLISASCTASRASVHSSAGTLSIRSNPVARGFSHCSPCLILKLRSRDCLQLGVGLPVAHAAGQAWTSQPHHFAPEQKCDKLSTTESAQEIGHGAVCGPAEKACPNLG